MLPSHILRVLGHCRPPALRLLRAASTTEEKITHNPYYKRYRYQLETLKKLNPGLYEKKLSDLVNPSDTLIPHKPEPIALPDNSRPPEVKELEPDLKKQLVRNWKQDLSSIMKIELLHTKSPEEIATIWKSYHLTKPCVAAVVPSGPFIHAIQPRSKKYPMFIYPVPRKNYIEYFLSQFDGNFIYFTLKDDYQRLMENSPVYFSMAYYPDMIDTKGIVLMRGSYDENVLTPQEAQLLANMVGLYYGTHHYSQTYLLYIFNKEPALFRPEFLMKELEKMATMPLPHN